MCQFFSIDTHYCVGISGKWGLNYFCHIYSQLHQDIMLCKLNVVSAVNYITTIFCFRNGIWITFFKLKILIKHRQ